MIKNASEFMVDQSIHIDAPQEAVFKLVSDPAQMKRWQPMDFFDGRVGGNYQFSKGEWIATGEILEIDPPNSVAYSWDWQNSPLGSRTVVKIELRKEGKGTVVRLTHAGFVDSERTANHTEGWTHYLKRLKTVAEGGDPGPDTMVA